MVRPAGCVPEKRLAARLGSLERLARFLAGYSLASSGDSVAPSVSLCQAPLSLAAGQCGSDGGVRQPQVEAWSIRARVARATMGRVSSAR